MKPSEMKKETVDTIVKTAASYKYSLDSNFPDMDKKQKNSYKKLFKMLENVGYNVSFDVNGTKKMKAEDFETLLNYLNSNLESFKRKVAVKSEARNEKEKEMDQSIENCFVGLIDRFKEFKEKNMDIKAVEESKVQRNQNFYDELIAKNSVPAGGEVVARVGSMFDSMIGFVDNIGGFDTKYPGEKSEAYTKFSNSFYSLTKELKKNAGVITTENEEKITELVTKCKHDGLDFLDNIAGRTGAPKAKMTMVSRARRDLVSSFIRYCIDERLSQFDKTGRKLTIEKKAPDLSVNKAENMMVSVTSKAPKTANNTSQQPQADNKPANTARTISEVKTFRAPKPMHRASFDVSKAAKELADLEKALKETRRGTFNKQSDQFSAFRKCLHVLNKSIEKNGNKISEKNIDMVSKAVIALEYAKIKYDKHCEKHPKPENVIRGERIMKVQHTMTEVGKLLFDNPEIKDRMSGLCGNNNAANKEKAYKEVMIEAIPEKNLHYLKEFI